MRTPLPERAMLALREMLRFGPARPTPDGGWRIARSVHHFHRRTLAHLIGAGLAVEVRRPGDRAIMLTLHGREHAPRLLANLSSLSAAPPIPPPPIVGLPATGAFLSQVAAFLPPNTGKPVLAHRPAGAANRGDAGLPASRPEGRMGQE